MATKYTPQKLASMRRLYRLMNKYLVVPLWELGLGKLINASPDRLGQVMVITHTGRKSGQTYRTPVNYAEVDGDIYCMAGFGKVTDWYRNILVRPQVEVLLPDSWWAGVAEDVTGSEDRVRLTREVFVGSGIAPSFYGIDVSTLTDDDMLKMAEKWDFRIVRIRRTEPRTGPGGPGEYDWVWPLAAMTLALLLLVRPRKRRRK